MLLVYIHQRCGSSIYPRIETGYAYTEKLKDEFVEDVSSQTFT